MFDKHFMRQFAVGTSGGLCAALMVGAPAAAQEGAAGPPPALQYPTQAGAVAERGVTSLLLRAAIDGAATTALCQALMQEAGLPVASSSDCDPAYRQKVENRQGAVRWASGARPIECGYDCFGRFTMTQTKNVDRPNIRRALAYGRLRFEGSRYGVTREVVYPYDLFATCDAANGARNGELRIEMKFGPPVIGDPGVFESILDFALLPVNISRRVDEIVRASLPAAPGQGINFGPCRSVGVTGAALSEDDMATYELPRPSMPTTDAMVGSTAKITFYSIKRNALPPMVDESHAAAGQPEAGYFTVYLNGVALPLPSPTNPLSGDIPLAPNGQTITLNYCRTISVSGADRLQVIFANGLGGAAWSEFPIASNFGKGAHKILSHRTIILPALPSPIGGSPKPRPFDLREFELSYSVDYQAPPTTTESVSSGDVAGAPATDVAPSASAGKSLKDKFKPKGKILKLPACKQI